VDVRATSHPATAQVAAQQGVYLARVFNASAGLPLGVGGSELEGVGGGEAGWKYRHMGHLSQLGGGWGVDVSCSRALTAFRSQSLPAA
jgi:NADH dehydrogenase FAD-containing subunit